MSNKVKITIIAAIIILITAALAVWEYFLNPDSEYQQHKTYYTYLSEIVNSRWDAQSEWNQPLYDSLARVISYAEMSVNIKPRQKNDLLVLNSSLALNAIYSCFDIEMQAPESRRSRVTRNYQGVKYLAESRNIEHSEEYRNSLRELQGMYSDYTKTMDFAARSLECKATVDADLKWTPFLNYRNYFNEIKSTLSSGRYFNSHFYKINIVKNSWLTYNERLNKAESEYCRKVDRQLKAKMDSTCNVGHLVDNVEEAFRKLSYDYNMYVSRSNNDQIIYDSEINLFKTQMADTRSELENLSELLKQRMAKLTDAQGRFVEETEGVQAGFYCTASYFRTGLSNISRYLKSVNTWLEELDSWLVNFDNTSVQ